MSEQPLDTSNAEAQAAARNGYLLMNLARIGGLACVIAGLAGTRDVLPIPFALGAIMAVGGMIAFFFAPPLLAKRWKSKETSE